MPVYRKIGRSMLEMNRGKPKASKDVIKISRNVIRLLNMASYESFWYFARDDAVHRVL